MTGAFSGGGTVRATMLAAVTLAVAGLIVAAALSLTIGTRAVGWAEIAGAVAGRTETIGEAAVAVRIPRTALALLVGAALALSGGVMQGLTRNPLADPGILGVNAGAAMAVVVGIAWAGMRDPAAFVWAGVGGAGAAACLVYAIGSMGPGGATPLKLTLAGTSVSIAGTAFVTALILPRNDISGSIQSWQVGGVGGATFSTLMPALPLLIAGAVICLGSAKTLNALALGEEMAAGLGQNVAIGKAVAALGAVLLCGAATALCGPIGFVGLVVPHLCRLAVGIDHRRLLPLSVLGGAILLCLADVAGRLVARPAELDAGLVTAFVGAPFFIWLVRRKRMRGL